MMIGFAALAALGEFLIIRVLEMALAVVIAPIHYTMIIYGTFWGYLVFGDLPDFWTWVGTTIVVCSGIYVIFREARSG